MTYGHLRTVWSLIDRTDGRLELWSCLYLPGDGDAWSLWVSDRVRGIDAYYRHMASFIAGYPSALLAAPAPLGQSSLDGAMSRVEILRAMDALDTLRDSTYAWVVVHHPIGHYALVRNMMDASMDEHVAVTYSDAELLLGL